jgi:glyoxylase-like metal-dependent hydrolase (beta-lactamase superfamily II)
MGDLLKFSLIQAGSIEITQEEGVKDSRPTSSLIACGDFNLVIDTEHPKEDGTEYLGAFGRLGLSPAQVDRVLFTHLHPDHFGHKELFRKAAFIYHKDDRFGFYFRNDPTLVLERSAILDLAAGAASQPVYVDAEPELRQLGSAIYVRHAPGHTPGSLMIFAAISGLVHAWVGDVFLNKSYYDEWRPPGSSWDPQRIYEHMEYVRDHADIVVPGHGAPFRINA